MRKILVITLALVLAFSFTAAAEERTPEEIIHEYTYGGTLVMAETQSPEGMFNPLFSETTYDAQVNDMVFEPLNKIDPQGNPIPALAMDWERDDLTYTFYLDERAKFHDGEPVTAHDVEFTFKTFMHPDYDGVRASNFMEIDGAEEFRAGETDEVPGIRVIDDHTIEIELRSLYAPFLVQTTIFGIVPEHILGEYEVSELRGAEFNQNPIGSGPFKFDEYSDDEFTRMSYFEDFRTGRPYLDEIVIRYVDDQALVMMIERGEVDYANPPGENFDRFTEMDNITIHQSTRDGFGYIGINVEADTPVADQAVRQAMAHGINRQGFIDVVMNGLGIVSNSPISQASWAYTDDLNPYEYDPDRAQEILEEDGWEMNNDGVYERDGELLEFTMTASSGSEFIDQLMALAQDNLNEIGFDVSIERLEFNTMTDQIDDGELSTWFMGWSFGADPDPYSVWHSEGDWNRTNWSNERADELIENARQTLDQVERREYYIEFQQIWNEDMPYIPMYADIYLHTMNDRVRGYLPDPGVVSPFGRGHSEIQNIWIPKHYR
ncbi:peptide-binding protein [Halanaerobiaceae bacterium Z-7014]|uniref:Peptide-binding protein n=1 Tax=Halonatronomonas betaini TaxID=2778430 RepID=A0A931ATT0_9FIRM|nr:peptide-binding protein [Halonatronomonas betaini]MBF8438049.1 peptide-binding protein [Halonatronomonas betaini]